MSLVFDCPSCGRKLLFADSFAGRRVSCVHCGQVVQLTRAEDVGEAPAPPVSRRARRRREAPCRLGWVLLLTVGGLVGVVLPAAVGVAVWWFGRDKAPQPSGPAVASSSPAPAAQPGDAGAPQPLPAVVVRPLSPEQIYRRLLKSAAWVTVPDPRSCRSMGSGVLIHKQQRLVLTAYHVVGGEREVTVFFPDYRNYEPISAPQHYLDDFDKNGKLAFKGKVVWTEVGKDLALVQLADPLPDNLQEVRLARKSPHAGQNAHSVGASGARIFGRRADGLLWRYARGEVRGLYRDTIRYDNGQTVNASLVETSSSVNPGDSGGPIVNDQVELIAVVSALSRDRNAVAKNIDVSEVEALVRAYFEKEVGQEWDQGPTDPGTRLAEQLATLTRQLDDPSPQRRLQAVNRLGELEFEAQAAFPHLLPLLKDPDADVARAAAVALDKIGTPSQVDLPLLHQALVDPHTPTRVYAARMIARDGMMTRDGLPAVLAAVRDRDANVREYAVVALGNYGPGWREALPLFIQLLHDEHEDRAVRLKVRDAADHLRRQVKPPHRPEFVRFFEQYLGDKDPSARLTAARVLCPFVSEDFRKLLPEVMKLLQDDDEEVRHETLKALLDPETLRHLPRDNVPALLTALKGRQPEVRRFGYAAIRRFLPDAHEALPDLVLALGDPDPEVREYAVEGLYEFGPDARQAVPGLRSVLRQPDSSVTLRRKVVDTLARMGRHPEMVTTLLAALEDNDADVRLRAEDTLLRREVTRDDLPALLRGLHNGEADQVRANAAEAIGRLGRDAASAVPNLLVAARDKRLAVRIRAVHALGTVGPEARAAVPVLTDLLGESPGEEAAPPSQVPTTLGLSPDVIYQRTLRSTVWILCRVSGRLVTGSGALIHLSRRLVLTNYHVVGQTSQVSVFFPQYRGGELLTRPATYMEHADRWGLTGTVLARDPTRDLAVLRLDRVPPEVMALPLASHSPRPNQTVYSVGASGVTEGVLWRSTTGQVRQVYPQQIDYPDGQRLRARIIETQAPTNSGDSGGPMVNERGELVGVVQGGWTDKQLVNQGIDISEVHAFLRDVCRRTGLNLTEFGTTAPASLSGTASELRAEAAFALGRIGPGARGAVRALREALRGKDPAVRASAIAALGNMGPEAREALGSLILELGNPDHWDQVVDSLSRIATEPKSVELLIDRLTNRNAEVRLGIVQALGKIGPPARKAVSRLAFCLNSDDDARVRRAASEALGRVQDKP